MHEFALRTIRNAVCINRLVLVVIGSHLSSFAGAHEGHGHSPAGESSTALHYLTEPVHLSQIGLVVLAVAAMAWWLKGAASKRLPHST